MDFSLTEEQESLRKEFDTFFAEEEKRAPVGWGGWIFGVFDEDDVWAYHCSVAGKLGQKGWLSLPWPRKYGGREHSYIEQLLFNEVRGFHRVPGVDLWGPQIVAPSLMEYGSEEIKQRWLPDIARAEINWCQGWTEPNSGSDLASLSTTAVADGDDFIINGQKIWTTGAHRADHIFILARTDAKAPKHHGLTYFISEMKSPGIKVRPLLFMNKSHEYNQVFFDNLRVPRRNIVGEVNQGWYVAVTGVNFERSMIGVFAAAKRDLEDLVKFCRETTRDGRPIADDPLVSHRLAEFAIELEAGRQWAYYVAWIQSKGKKVPGEASAAKYTISESIVRLANFAVESMGLCGVIKHGSKWSALHGTFENLCQASLGGVIAGGTTETQKNIIAWMSLGLPRT